MTSVTTRCRALPTKQRTFSKCLSAFFHSAACRFLQYPSKLGQATSNIDHKIMFAQQINPATGASEWILIHADQQQDVGIEKKGFQMKEEDDTGDADHDENNLQTEKQAERKQVRPDILAGSSRSSNNTFFSEQVAASSYLDMLNDDYRNKIYAAAIEKVLKAGDHVLDVGSGTGLLAMLAQRTLESKANIIRTLNPSHASSYLEKTNQHHHHHQQQSHPSLLHLPSHANPISAPQDPKSSAISNLPSESSPSVGHVTTCESFPPMAHLARRVIEVNGMGTSIRLIGKRSDEMECGAGKDLPQKADVMVSEILDSELLGEGLLPTLRHAHANLLKEGAKIIPNKATVYAQVVESSFLRRCHDLNGIESELPDELRLVPRGILEGCHVPSQWAVHVDPLKDHLKLLSEPFEVFTFDFTTPPMGDRKVKSEVKVIQDGQAHAIISWWVLNLDEEGSLQYSTAPLWVKSSNSFQTENNISTNQETMLEGAGQSGCASSAWRDHWRQCIAFLPGNGCHVSTWRNMVVTAQHDDVSIRYGVECVLRESEKVGSGEGCVGKGANLGLKEEEIKAREGATLVNIILDERVGGSGGEKEKGEGQSHGQFDGNTELKLEGEMLHIERVRFGGQEGPKMLKVKPERILAMGSRKLREILKTTIEKTLENFTSPHFLFTDDSLLLPSMTNSIFLNSNISNKGSNEASITALLPGLGLCGKYLLENSINFVNLSNTVNSASLVKSVNSVNSGEKSSYLNTRKDEKMAFRISANILQKGATDVTSDDLQDRKVHILMAEPYYQLSEASLPWKALRFWHDVSALRHHLAAGGDIIPFGAVLRGVLVSLPDLWKSRRAIDDVIGFDHRVANQILGAVGGFSNSFLPRSVWQCGRYEELSDHFSLLTFEMSTDPILLQADLNVPITRRGWCHAIVLWLDWRLLKNDDSLLVSGRPTEGGEGPQVSRQGVRLLSTPVLLGRRAQCANISVSFDEMNLEVDVDVSFS